MCIFSVYMIDSGSPTKTTKFNPSIKKKAERQKIYPCPQPDWDPNHWRRVERVKLVVPC